jgi:hypothetical protein
MKVNLFGGWQIEALWLTGYEALRYNFFDSDYVDTDGATVPPLATYRKGWCFKVLWLFVGVTGQVHVNTEEGGTA